MGMSCTQRGVAVWRSRGWLPVVLGLLATAMASFLVASPARGSTGYEPSSPNPALVTGIEFPHGVAVDQANHRVYVAVVTDDIFANSPGGIRRFESNGQAAGIFGAAPNTYFSGVAVNPVTQGFYGSRIKTPPAFGSLGTPQVIPFSSAGAMGTPFAVSFNETLPQIAADSTGDVYFPSDADNAVQVFNSAGVLQETIGCGDCPGGPFGKPVSVAIGSDNDLYVADLAPDRVVKLTVSGGSYKFDSVVQSGRSAVAVGVDPSNDDVFVGDLPGGKRFHVVAYDSSGAQFDDFGAGLFIDPELGATAAPQIAADATTHKLYISQEDEISVFERVVISPPSAVANPPSAVGQITATLKATVDAEGHAVLNCNFEYTDEADFLVNSFSNATSVPCPGKPDGSDATSVEAGVSGLSADTAYRYRVKASNNGGSVASGGETFQTLPVVPPTVTMESPLSVTQTSATLRGKVNPHGGSVSSCRFEMGTSTSYGSNLSCLPVVGPVTTDAAVARKILTLAPGTVYHYRLVVSTNAGTVEGDDVEFTTMSPPVEPEPEPAAPTPTPAPPPSTDPVTPPPPPLQCGKGFRRQTVQGKARCVKVCRKGFRRKRVHGKVRCERVRRSGGRAGRQA
jgi:hypothetical protein